MSSYGVKLDGKPVDRIIFPDNTNIAASRERVLEYECVNHGDHDECWIVEKDRETQAETARHNIRFISDIYWTPEEAKPDAGKGE
jgi:hypothetical protein